METTSYDEAWRAFQKWNFGLCSTTYYSTVPITWIQTQLHCTQSLLYGKSLKHSSLRHIITTNFVAMIYRFASQDIVGLMCGVKCTSDVRDHNLRYWLKTQGGSFGFWVSGSPGVSGVSRSLGLLGSPGSLGLWVFGSLGLWVSESPGGLWVSGSLGG